MKILLSDQAIKQNVLDPKVKTIRYSGQTFDVIKQQIIKERPVDLAIVLSEKLAGVIPFFEENIVSDFFKELETLKTISFYGDKFELTQKYIDYFGELQQNLKIGIFYADKKGITQRVFKRAPVANPLRAPEAKPQAPEAKPQAPVANPLRAPEAKPLRAPLLNPLTQPMVGPIDSNAILQFIKQNNNDVLQLVRGPSFFAKPFLTEPPLGFNENNDLFDPCNTGSSSDKAYFTRKQSTPCYHKLSGDLTIDNTKNFVYPIPIENGAIFDGCGHTITLTSSVPLHKTEEYGGFKGLFDLQNGIIRNVTIKVNTEYVTLADGAGWLCVGRSASEVFGKTECTIDNCHVHGKLYGFEQGGLVGPYSFLFNVGSTITLQNCSFIGDINGESCGGIVANGSFNFNIATKITIQNCCFSGKIYGSANGAIVGGAFVPNKGPLASGDDIFEEFIESLLLGSFNINIVSTITIQNCSARGDIIGPYNSGGIGAFSFWLLVGSTMTIEKNCFVGDIYGGYDSGCVGSYSVGLSILSVRIIKDCSYKGDIYGVFNSGIIGDNCFLGWGYISGTIRSEDLDELIESLRSTFKITIQNAIIIKGCSFSGNVFEFGFNNGGRSDIFGREMPDLNSGIVGFGNFREILYGTVTIQECLVSGDISSSGWGGVVGGLGFLNAQSTNVIQDCYSFCNFTVYSFECGGILGPSCGRNAKRISVNNCYSTGTNLGANQNGGIGPKRSTTGFTTYAILGIGTVNCDVSNCVYNSYRDTIAGPDYNVQNPDDSQNTYHATFGTTNIIGRAKCNKPYTVQIICTQYDGKLHLKFAKTDQSDKLKVVSAFSICKALAKCSVITFVFENVCESEKLYIYSKDLKFKSQLHRDNNNNAAYLGTLARGTYIIVSKK